MSRSISTTSGASCAQTPRRPRAPSAATPDELDVVERRDQPAEAVADHAVVVGEQDADHRVGTSSSTVVPAPGAERTDERAAGLRDDVLEQREPDVALGAALLACLRREAARRRRSRRAACVARTGA